MSGIKKKVDPKKVEQVKAEAEKHLGQPVLLTEYTLDQVEEATHLVERTVSASPDTKSCC